MICDYEEMYCSIGICRIIDKERAKDQNQADRKLQEQNFMRTMRSLRTGPYRQINPTMKRIFKGKQGR